MGWGGKRDWVGREGLEARGCVSAGGWGRGAGRGRGRPWTGRQRTGGLNEGLCTPVPAAAGTGVFRGCQRSLSVLSLPVCLRRCLRRVLAACIQQSVSQPRPFHAPLSLSRRHFLFHLSVSPPHSSTNKEDPAARARASRNPRGHQQARPVDASTRGGGLRLALEKAKRTRTRTVGGLPVAAVDAALAASPEACPIGAGPGPMIPKA